MGERVTVGSLVYNVFDSQWAPQLGDGADARIPEHRFFLVRVSIVNSGSAESMIPTMTLQDESGQTYSELSNGDQAPQWIGYLRKVKPADTLQGIVLFDVPPKQYQIRLSDESDLKAELVEIPLSFGQESGPLPGPSQ